MISIPKHWPGSTPPPIPVCMVRPERSLLRGLRSEGLQDASKALTYDTSVLTTRRSSKDCFISYGGNLYSVPATCARKTLQVKITEAEELVICSEVGNVLARHHVLLGRQERSVQADHYRGLGTPVSRIERLLPCRRYNRLIARCSGMRQSSKCVHSPSTIDCSGRCHERVPL